MRVATIRNAREEIVLPAVGPTARWPLVALAAALGVAGLAAPVRAQTQPAEPVSRGENFSAKPAPQLFASDCTGSGCHRAPQGLAKGMGAASLAGFLRAHYTNSRESAAALAAYLVSLANAPVRPERAEPRAARPSPPTPAGPSPAGRASRAAASPEDGSPAAAAAPGAPARRAGEADPQAARARATRTTQRGKPVPAPPLPSPEPVAAAPEPQPKQQFDIFD